MNTEIALTTIITLLFVMLYDNFKIRVTKQKEQMPKDVFSDLMDNKCNSDCENCVCKNDKHK